MMAVGPVGFRGDAEIAKAAMIIAALFAYEALLLFVLGAL